MSVRGLGRAFRTFPLAFTAGASTDAARLEIVSSGRGAFRVGAVSLMPADNVLGWRRDTIVRLRELDAPVYRWPGGNFVSGYDWRDGIGDPDRRPPRKNPAWKGVEANDVGLHEFMDLKGLIGAEPYVAVNTGLGDSRSAADLVEYANGAPGTAMGQLRAKNGRTKPFAIRLWAVDRIAVLKRPIALPSRKTPKVPTGVRVRLQTLPAPGQSPSLAQGVAPIAQLPVSHVSPPGQSSSLAQRLPLGTQSPSPKVPVQVRRSRGASCAGRSGSFGPRKIMVPVMVA